MDSIMGSSNAFSTILYLIVGIFAVLNYGPNTEGNVLKNFASSDIVAIIGR